MENDSVQKAAEQILQDESLVAGLEQEEVKSLLDWAIAELSSGSVNADVRSKTVQAAVREIGALIADKATLVSDDLEERMATLLVGDLDASSQVRLQIEREIAQVTAEKDHLDNLELLRQFTALASQAWRSKAAHAAQAVPLGPRHAATAQVRLQADEIEPATAASSQNATAMRQRPIPRPTPMPAKKSLLARILGR